MDNTKHVPHSALARLFIRSIEAPLASERSRARAEAIEKLFKLSPLEEALVMLDVLRWAGDKAPDSVESLMTDLKGKSEYVQGVRMENGRVTDAVLFAIPVFTDERVTQRSILPGDMLQTFVEQMRQAELLDEFAEVHLVPQILHIDELKGRSFGEMHAVARHLAQQACAATPSAVQLPTDFWDSPPPVTRDWHDMFGLHLNYILGVAVGPRSILEHAFPEIDISEHLPSEPGVPRLSLEELVARASKLEEAWEEVAVAQVFKHLHSVLPPLKVERPSSFYGAVEASMDVARQVGMCDRLSTIYDALASQASDFVAELAPFRNVDSGLCEGYIIEVIHTDARRGSIGYIPWDLFAHETPSQSLSTLRGALDAQGIRVRMRESGFIGGIDGVELH